MQRLHQIAEGVPPVLRRDLEVRQPRGLLQPVVDGGHGLRQVPGRRRRVEAAGRHHALAVPEAVEGLRSLAGDGTEAEGIEVAKAEIRRQAEVFVADVAAAEDAGKVVRDQPLVVLALVAAVAVKAEEPLSYIK